MDKALIGLVSRHRHPCRNPAIGDDEPDLAIMGGAGRIARARLGAAIGVAVVMADDLAVFGADVAVRGQQGARIDFETGGGVRVNILCRHHGFGKAGFASNKAATFVRECGARRRQKGFDHPA